MVPYPRYVYALKCNANGKIYVGSTINLERRLKAHLQQLKKRTHANKNLQTDFDTYGNDFSMSVLDFIETPADSHIEYTWMEKLNTNNPEIGYNYADPYFCQVFRTGNRNWGLKGSNL